MTKDIKIRIVFNEKDDKIATAINIKGLDKNSLTDQFTLLGILENLVDLQKEKLKVLMKV
jgi:hypothetical protein